MLSKKWKLTKNQWFTIGKMVVCTTLLLSASCKKKTALKNEESEGLPKDFVAFYEQFHKDSVYQMAHITFPLDGYPTQADSSIFDKGGYRWQKENWKMHKLNFFNDTLYTRQFQAPIEGVVIEVVKQNNTPFGIYRRFFKRGNEWFLIFYSDMNTIAE